MGTLRMLSSDEVMRVARKREFVAEISTYCLFFMRWMRDGLSAAGEEDIVALNCRMDPAAVLIRLLI
jgi:hypothetical protein